MKSRNRKVGVLRFIWGVIPWVVVILIILFIVMMLGRVREEKKRVEAAKIEAMKKKVPPVKVITLTLNPKIFIDKISLPAEVEPFENLWVKAEVPGQILKIHVDEGQFINKGALLVSLDGRDYRSRLERIEANYKLAKVEYDRTKELVRQKITAESRLDETEARLKDLIAQRREAKLALDRSRIIAPIDGRINEIQAKQGDLLKVGDEVLQILQFDQVKVMVGVPESDVAAVLDLEEANVVIDALGKETVTGKKIFLSRQPRTLARLYDMELLVDNPAGRILPGMFARVELVKDIFLDALAIPLYAIITRGNEHFVYVEHSGRVKRRAVQLGVLSGWEVHVRDGLSPGERVIVVGHRLLDDGQEVDVIRNVTDPREILGS